MSIGNGKGGLEMMEQAHDHFPRILVFQTAFLGDLVLTLPLIHSLRSEFPEAHIAVVTKSSSASLLKDDDDINEVILFDKHGKAKGPGGTLRFARELRKQKFSLAFVPHRSFRSGLITVLAGIPKRVGFMKTGSGLWMTEHVRRDNEEHEIQRNLSLLSALSIEPHSNRPIIARSVATATKVHTWMSTNNLELDSYLALAPGSVWETKKWPERHWKALIKLLSDLPLKIVLVGGPDDHDLCERLLKNNGADVINSAGQFNPPESAELIGGARAIVSGDSAPVHLATGVNTQVFAIFGPTVPEFGFAPSADNDIVLGLDLSCRPCAIHGSNDCPLVHHDCMKKLSPEAVFDIIKKNLA